MVVVVLFEESKCVGLNLNLTVTCAAITCAFFKRCLRFMFLAPFVSIILEFKCHC